ncbi:MAG: hypothetical protein WCO30_01900 [bacterium]
MAKKNEMVCVFPITKIGTELYAVVCQTPTFPGHLRPPVFSVVHEEENLEQAVVRCSGQILGQDPQERDFYTEGELIARGEWKMRDQSTVKVFCFYIAFEHIGQLRINPESLEYVGGNSKNLITLNKKNVLPFAGSVRRVPADTWFMSTEDIEAIEDCIDQFKLVRVPNQMTGHTNLKVFQRNPDWPLKKDRVVTHD